MPKKKSAKKKKKVVHTTQTISSKMYGTAINSIGKYIILSLVGLENSQEVGTNIDPDNITNWHDLIITDTKSIDTLIKKLFEAKMLLGALND